MSVPSLQGSGSETNVPRSVTSQSDTVGALIERVKAAANSKDDLTNEQLNDIDTYVDLEIKYRKLLELEEQSGNPNFGLTSSSPKKAPAPQVEAVPTGETTLPKGSIDVSEVSPNISSNVALDEQKEGTRSLEAERFEKEARAFNQISKEDLQSHLDWMSSTDERRPPETENDSQPSLIERANQGFWKTVSYFYPTKK